jgi:crotonobetainyl-CoA:carnitine CoA-transferase CaiB-like acyl-CoA transferase
MNRFMRDFFNGLKVVELASVLAGPAVGTFFAELGADVLKVENKKTGGDVTRGWRTTGEEKGQISAYYSSVNYGKQVLMADLTDTSEHRAVLEAVHSADIVISNYLPRVAAKFSLDYPSVKSENPKTIYLDLAGYENEGKPAYDVVLQAETGWISMTGTNRENPAKLPVALIDVLAGHQLKEAALLALIHKERTGEGSYTRCSLEASSLSALANQASNYLMSGKTAQPIGTRHPNIAPYGDWFETADGIRFVLAVGSERHFLALTEVLNCQELANDDRFNQNSSRVKYRDELIALLNERISKRHYAELAAALKNAGVPFGEIKSLDRVLQTETAQSMILNGEIESHQTKRLSGLAFKMSF